MTGSRPVSFVGGMTGVPDADGDVFEVGAFHTGLAIRQPRIVGGHDWNQPLGRVADLVELRPGDPRLPARTDDGRRWPRAAGALVGSAVYNLATKGGAEAFEAATAGPGPHPLTLGFRVSRSSRRGRLRVIEAADVFTLAPPGVALSGKGIDVRTFETKAGPGARSRPWEQGKQGKQGQDRPTDPTTISADEVDELHEVDDDVSLSLSPDGMTTVRCSLCSREHAWADVPPTISICEDCARQSSAARVRRSAEGGGTAGRDRESQASQRVRATFPKVPRSGGDGQDAAGGDPRYSHLPNGQLVREDTSGRRPRSSAPTGAAAFGPR